jgi:hypothetical protein
MLVELQHFAQDKKERKQERPNLTSNKVERGRAFKTDFKFK